MKGIDISNRRILVLCFVCVMAGMMHQGCMNGDEPESFWVPTGGKAMGSSWAECLWCGPDGTLFAGTISGIYRSTDSGITWVRNGEIPNWMYVRSFESDRRGHLFACGKNVLRSSDNGDHWEILPLSRRESYGSLMIDSSYDVFVSLVPPNYPLNSGFLVSRDGGNTWSEMTDLPADTVYGSMITTERGTILLRTVKGIYRSVDHGSHWERTYSDGNNTWLWFVPCVGYGEKGRIYASRRGIAYSDDDGITWTDINGAFTESFVYLFRTSQGTYYIGKDPMGVYRSTNGGRNWEEFNAGLYPNAGRYEVRAMTMDRQGYGYVSLLNWQSYRSRYPLK